MNNLNNGTARSKAYSLNNIKLIGTIASEAAFSHEVVRKGEADNRTLTFRRFTLEAPRLSGVPDFLEVIISEETWLEFTNRHEYINGENLPPTVVEISGRLQSHNRIDLETGKNKLDLFVLAKSIRCLTTIAKDNDTDNDIAAEPDKSESLNTVSFEGFVCKKPVIRQTHSGRAIADLFIAVNGRGTSAYIPVILWGGNAVNAKDFKPGDKLRLTGRFQSREYTKGVNGVIITNMVYEVSASKVKLLDDNAFIHC